jgi:hypothetical protein
MGRQARQVITGMHPTLGRIHDPSHRTWDVGLFDPGANWGIPIDCEKGNSVCGFVNGR